MDPAGHPPLQGLPRGNPVGPAFSLQHRRTHLNPESRKTGAGGRLPRSNGCDYGGSSGCLPSCSHSKTHHVLQPPPISPTPPCSHDQRGNRGELREPTCRQGSWTAGNKPMVHSKADSSPGLPHSALQAVLRGLWVARGLLTHHATGRPSSQRLLPCALGASVCAPGSERLVVFKSPDPKTTCFPRSLQAEFKAGMLLALSACRAVSSGSNQGWLFPASPLRPSLPRADPGPKLAGNKTLAVLCRDTMASAEGASAPRR